MTGNALNPLSLLGNQYAIREIGRATIDAVLRKVKDVQIVGATVRSSAPAAASIVVHIDGDPPAEARSVTVATQEFFEVGRRVYVALYPPSGALVLGGIGATAPWIDYPSGAPDPAFYSAQNKTPTFSVVGGNTALFPGTNPTSTFSSLSLPANSWIYIAVGTRLTGGYKGVSSWSMTGTPLDWELVASQDLNETFFSGTLYLHGEMWRAYNESAQTVSLTLTWSNTTTGAKAFVQVVSAANARRVQDAVGSNTATSTASNDQTVNVTTTVNYAQILSLAVGGSDNFITTFTYTADSGCTEISQDTGTDDGYSGMILLRRTSGVATPASTAIGATSNALGGQAFGLVIGVEVQGVPDVPVAGDGTFKSTYRLLGRTLHQRLTVVGGSTTTYGGGNLGLHLPPGMVAAALPSGGIQTIAGALRTATNFYRLVACISSGAAYFDKVLYQDGSTTYLTATTPATLGSSTLLSLEGAIEIDPA